MMIPGIVAGGVYSPGGGAGSSDPLFEHVVALLNFQGEDESTTFADEVEGNVWTASGDAQIDTSQAKSGVSSLLLDGNGDYIQSSSQTWAIGTDDFCVEAWVRFNGTPGDTCFACHYLNTGNQRAWSFSHISGELRFFASVNGGGSVVQTVAGTWSPSADTWYHIAAARGDGTMQLYVDGGAVASTSHSIGIFNSNQPMIIGKLNASGFERYHNGWIGAFRKTIGHKRYTGAFTPEAPFAGGA